MAKFEDLKNSMAEMYEKADKYDSMKEFYAEISKDIVGIKEDLTTTSKKIDLLMRKINPVLDLGMKQRKATSINYEEVVQELYLKMQEGTYITSALIEQIYSTKKTETGYIIKMLGKLPRVQKAKDGIKVRLFHQ